MSCAGHSSPVCRRPSARQFARSILRVAHRFTGVEGTLCVIAEGQLDAYLRTKAAADVTAVQDGDWLLLTLDPGDVIGEIRAFWGPSQGIRVRPRAVGDQRQRWDGREVWTLRAQWAVNTAGVLTALFGAVPAIAVNVMAEQAWRLYRTNRFALPVESRVRHLLHVLTVESGAGPHDRPRLALSYGGIARAVGADRGFVKEKLKELPSFNPPTAGTVAGRVPGGHRPPGAPGSAGGLQEGEQGRRRPGVS